MEELFFFIIVFVSGNETVGSNRWLFIAGFSFQPSELAKVTVILTLARYYHDYYFISNKNISLTTFIITSS